MDSDQSDTPHKVFTNDPLFFKSLVNNVVEIETVHGSNVKGILYTVDPVSETVILLNPEDDSLKMDIVMGFNVKSIKSVQSTDVPLIPENLFKEDWAKYVKEEDVEKKRVELKKWLTDNSIPIVESGKLLKLDDILTIEPPYGVDQVMSSNEIVLGRIQNLLKSMPA